MTDYINSSIGDNSTELFRSNIANIIQIPLHALIFILAFVYIILILTRKTFRSNKLNWPTVNVCLATALFSLIQLIFTSVHVNNLANTLISCRLQGFLIGMVACHMMYSHCVSSFDRLLSIRYFNKPLFRSCRWLLSSIGIGWILGLFVSLPYLFYDGFACSSNNRAEFLKPYSCVITFLIPISIVAVCNVSILWYVRRSSQRVQPINNNGNQNNISRKRDLHLCITMLITFSVFVIGWTPIFFDQLFSDTDRQLPTGVSAFFQILLPVCLLIDMIVLIYAYQPVRKLIIDAFKYHGGIPCAIKRQQTILL